MKKLITLYILITMLAVSLCACSVSVSPSDSSSSDSLTSDTSSSSMPASFPNSQSSDNSSQSDLSSSDSSSEISSNSVSEDLFSWNIKFDGKNYTIPCDYKEFKKNGWKLEEGENDTLKANQYTLTAYLKKDDKSVLVQLWNPTTSPVKFSEAKVGSIEVNLKDELDIELPGGFVFDNSVTVDDVKAKYGEPDEKSKGNNYKSIKYKQAIYSRVEFFIYDNSNMSKNNYVEIKNFI